MTSRRSYRKWTREEAAAGLRYLHEIYGVAPATRACYFYLFELERAVGRTRRLPSPEVLYRFWPNPRDAWRAAGIKPDRDLSRLELGYEFDDETDGLIRRAYEEHPLRRERLPALRRAEAATGIPAPALALRAAQLGVEHLSEPEWTEEELRILRRTQHLSKQEIARALAAAGYRRSHQAGRIIRARQELLNSEDPSHYSKEQLARRFGLDSHCVGKWLAEGWLPYEMKGTARKRQQGGDTYLVAREAVFAFVRRHPELVDLRKVDQAWLLGLLRSGEEEERAAEASAAKARPANRVPRREDLPAEYGCRLCGLTKPTAEMIVVHVKREDVYYLRPRCKECHNAKERGHRRKWKREYLQRWRADNAELNESYWKNNPKRRESARVNGARRFDEHHHAILIQGRMRRAGSPVSLKEASRLLKRFGPCYPFRTGLTPEGLRECERIRGAIRRRGTRRRSAVEIRMLVYHKGLFIEPALQKPPYQKAAERLRALQRRRREERAAA